MHKIRRTNLFIHYTMSVSTVLFNSYFCHVLCLPFIFQMKYTLDNCTVRSFDVMALNCDDFIIKKLKTIFKLITLFDFYF